MKSNLKRVLTRPNKMESMLLLQTLALLMLQSNFLLKHGKNEKNELVKRSARAKTDILALKFCFL